MRNHSVRPMAFAAVCLALAYILPNFTGNIPQIGSMLLPMHLPVLLCGFLAGGPWGAAVGFVAPLLRSLVFQRPVFFPSAVAMAFELATYGLVAGLASLRLGRGPAGRYAALVCAMLCGRVIWGIVMAILSLSGGAEFSLSIFIAGAFLNAVPGIVLQLVVVPALVMALDKSRLLQPAV